MTRFRPGLLRSTVSGYIDRDILEVLMNTRDAEARIRPHAVHYFHDWTKVTGYETAVRVAATKYMMDIPKPYTHVHIITRSKFVNMGVTVAMLALQMAGRPFYAHLTLPSFEHEFKLQCD